VNADLPAWLMSGAGNEFLVLDARPGLPATLSVLARRLCPPGAGFGVDGVLAVLEAEGDHIQVGFANADGSEGAFCGNGARCLARFCHETGLTGARPVLQFPGLAVRCRDLGGGQGEVTMPIPRIVERRIPLPMGGDWQADLVDAGVPHLVLVVEEPEAFPLERLGPTLRHLPRTGPDGANVTVCSPRPPGVPVPVRTFERGVDAVTGACGSGALAAAALLHDRGVDQDEILLRPPSGRLLRVRWEGAAQVVLTGDARCRMRGVIPVAVLRDGA
jgi:diaminopimelate epimerase